MFFSSVKIGYHSLWVYNNNSKNPHEPKNRDKNNGSKEGEKEG
jgi:hypothetical protein